MMATWPSARTDRMATGANSGIGLAAVLEVSRRGYRVVGAVGSDSKATSCGHRHVRRTSGRTAIFDVTDAAAAAEIVDRYRPYAVVNNAGYSITGAIEDVTDSEALAALETMVSPPCASPGSDPHIRERREGRIVNVSSIYGRVTTPLTGWYQGAKHALEALTDALRMEVAGSGIRVVLVEPGGLRTGIWEETEREDPPRRTPGSRYDPRTPDAPGHGLAQPIMGAPGQVAKVVAGTLSGLARSALPRGY